MHQASSSIAEKHAEKTMPPCSHHLFQFAFNFFRISRGSARPARGTHRGAPNSDILIGLI
jgi:hypothetical protein